MIKLLRANLFRLRQNKVFWFGLLAMLILSIVCMLNGGRQAAQMRTLGYQNYNYMDTYYFKLAPSLGIFFAIVISLFLGTEYSDGTLRNKVIVGHTRTEIYVANLLTCILCAFVFTTIWLIGGLIGLPLFPAWQMALSSVLLYILMALLFSAALAAIFTLIGMLSSNKAATAVVSILIFLGLLIGASLIYNKLAEPEIVSGVVMTTEGMQMSDPEPNPDYISGTARTALELLLKVLPTGQALLMSSLEIKEPILPMVSSLIITLLVTLLGISIFRKKDLK